ncbi:MAG: TonB-dependent receptor, partial [Bacteroidales bacterium]|nr:TonB-dependent receptor [Bacteroidales bacterium]
MKLSKLLLLTAGLFLGFSLFAQNTIKGVLVDETTGEPLGFATVSLTQDGQTKPTKYVLSNDKGAFTLESVRNGSYTIAAELMGYVAYKAPVKMESKAIDLSQIKMKVDQEVLEAAEVSAIGNPIVIKKDTVEYNMAAFKPTDTDNLIDVLKKMPGIEVGDDGTITANGETVKKITIEGKTFFLNDPSVATQNLPAKVINKLKVIRKKSEQAEFTGIDDGEEETVIDLNVHPGMMQGLMGRATLGVGHDVPAAEGDLNDWRYVGNVFLGKFTQKTQLSLVLNGGNTNGGRGGGRNNGGGGFGGGGGMGGGGGISTSYGGGLNAATEAFDGRMQVGGNYNYNHRSNESLTDQSSINYSSQETRVQDSHSASTSGNDNHTFGLRLEHKFSDNASIIFEPQVDFGTSTSASHSSDMTWRDDAGVLTQLNDQVRDNSSASKNTSTSGYLLYRQRLGIPGRTLTANVRYSLSKNSSDALNNSTTNYWEKGTTDVLNQHSVNGSNNYQTSARMTYTEPLGNYFYLEGNYNFSWNKSNSEKTTYDMLNGGVVDYLNTNATEQVNRRHEIGGNVLFQNQKFHMQAGFSAMPNYTYKKSDVYDQDGILTPQVYEDNRFNFSPQAMMTWNPNDNWNLRLNYRGTSTQPQTSDLMPVPDLTNVVRVRFGNPTLTPYFSHNFRTNVRYNNREKFVSANFSLNGGLTQNPITTLSINAEGGRNYSMPFNGPTIGNAGANYFFNVPFGRSAFSLSNQGMLSFNQSFSYEGVNVDMSKYTDEGFYEFMDWFIERFNDPAYHRDHIVELTTNNLQLNEMLRLTYRGSAVNFNLSGNTRMSRTFYNQKGAAASQSTRVLATTMTWTNNVSAEFTWTWTAANMDFMADVNYRWYNGFTTPLEPMTLVNATINKRLGPVTLSLSVTDLLAQSRALSVTDNSARHSETLSNTLGRYILLSFSYSFNNMAGRGRGRGGMGGNRGGGMGGGMMGGGFRGGMGG